MATEKYKEILRLKALFDEGAHELKTDYWSKDLLQTYSETLGERIHWKWNAFLADLKSQSIDLESLFAQQDQNFEVLDWGCGPGTASLALAEATSQKDRLAFRFEDRSKIAVTFSEARLNTFLSREAQTSVSNKSPALKIILISYVLSELDTPGLESLSRNLKNFDLFMWVDSGSHQQSHRLSEMRNLLTEDFFFLAPCPHQFTCPLSRGNHPEDWCHRFAKAPPVAFHSAHWTEFSKVFGVDLRSLPYSSLFAVKKSVYENKKLKIFSEDRRLGRPRVGKFEVGLDYCATDGQYIRKKVSKRASPELFKKLKKEF